MKKYIVSIVLILSLIFVKTYAQTDTEFWFVKPNITQNHTNETFKIVFTTREFAADVQIEMPAEPGFTTVNFSIAAFTTYTYTVAQPSATFTLMENSTIVDELSVWPPADQDNIGNKAILVTSTAPINAYLTQTATNNSDIYALKGANGLGTEFIIPFQEHGFNQADDFSERAFSAIDIISFEDGTVVEITPPPGKDVYRSGTFQNQTVPYQVTINRGEVYTVAPGWDPTVMRSNTANSGWWRVEGFEHLGGIIVKVITGNGVAVVKKDDSVRKGLDVGASDGGWDEIGDQWVPYKGVVGSSNDILGTEYVAMRGGLNNGWEWVYVAAPENNTRIWWGNSIDTTVAPNAILNRGQQTGIQFDNGAFTNNYMEIISNKPLSVLHVSGVGKEMGGAVLPPIDKCTGSTSVSFARDINWPLYINIMARAGHEGAFLVDGVVRNDIIVPGSFVPVGSTGEWVATQVYYTGAQTADFNADGTVHTISNTEDVFHIGLINGNSTGGCRFGYFSDFNELRVSANTIQGDGAQPSSTIRACKGDTVQLYAAGGSVFSWWPSTNLSSTTISNPTAVVDDFRTYYVEVSGACDKKDTATVTIEMAAQPNAVFFTEKGAGCAPLDIEIWNLSSDVNQIYWDFNTSLIGGVVDRDTIKFDPSVTKDVDSVLTHTFFNTSFEPVDTPQTYNVQLKVKSTKCTDEFNTTVTVYPEITADFTLSNLNDTVSCNPVVVDFESSVLSVNEDFYKWNFGDGASSAAGDTTHEYVNVDPDNDVTYTARLVARSQWNCRDTARQDFTVHPYLEAGFTIDKDEGCSPVTVNFTNTSVGEDNISLVYGDGTPNYTNATFITVQHIYTNTGTTVLKFPVLLTAYNDEGCLEEWKDTITVYPEIRANYTIDNNSGKPYSGCNSRTVTFTNSSNDGTHTASRYLWEFDDGTSMDTTNNTINKFYDNTTLSDQTYNFRLTARSIYGCTDDTTNSIDIYRAEANFTVDNNDGCSPLPVKVTNVSVGNQITIWDWNYGDGHTDNVIDPFPYTYINKSAGNQTNPLVLKVTGTNGCSTSKNVDIVVYPQIEANYTTTLKPVTSCDSLIAVFNTNVINAGLAGTASYTWDFGDLGSSSNQSPTHVFKNLSLNTLITRRVDLHVETPYGCSFDTSSFIDVYPLVNAKFTVDQVAGCSPLTVDAVATKYIGINPATNYKWTYGDGYNPNMSDPSEHLYPSAPPGAPGNYTLRLDVSDLSGTCTDFATRTITVYDEALADFTPKTPIGCNEFTFTFNSGTSQNASIFKWDFDDLTSSSDPNPEHTFTNDDPASPAVYNVELEVTSDDGCTSTYNSNVSVRPLVLADFDINISEGCSPFTVSIINNSSGSEFFWFWDDNTLNLGSPDSNLPNPGSHAYVLTTGGSRIDSLTLIVGNGQGCYDTLKRAVKVNSSLDAQFTYSQPDICNPSEVTFNSSSTSPLASVYKWDFGNGSTEETTIPTTTKTFTNNTNGDYYFTVNLTAESAEGCTSTTSDVVTVHSYVDADFDINISEGCSPLPVTVTNNSTLGASYTYEWFWDNNSVGPDSLISNASFFKYFYNSTGVDSTYTVKLVVDNGWGCKDSISRDITVYSSLVAGFTFSQPDSCTDSDVTFSDATIPAVGGYNYSWNFDDGSFSTTTASTFTKKFSNGEITDHDYHVGLTVESPNGCTSFYTEDVTVYSNVVADFSIPLIAKCPPFENAVIVNNSIGDNLNTYEWYVDGILDQTITGTGDFIRTYDNTNHLAARPYPIRLVAYNSHGCTSQKSDVINVFAYVEADFSVDVAKGCDPLQVNFTDNSLVPAGTTYSWDFNDGATSAASEPSHDFFNPSRTDSLKRTVYLKVKSPNLCSDNTSMELTIYHNPLAKFFINRTSSCPPLTSTLIKESLGEDAFEWRFGDGNKNTVDANLSYSWDNIETDNPLPQIYNLELWVGTANNCVDSTNLDLSVFPKVTADFTMDRNSGCSPVEDIQFTNASTSPATNFFWTFGDGTTTNLEDPMHDFVNITSVDRDYDVYLLASSEYNCKDDITKQVTVYVQPEAEFYVDPVLLKFPNNIVGFDNKTNSGPFDYVWEFGNIDASTSTVEEPISFEYDHWGEKIIKLTATHVAPHNECTDYYLDTVIILPPDVNADFITDIIDGCVNKGEVDGLDVLFTASQSAFDEEYDYSWDFDDGSALESGRIVSHTFDSAGVYKVQLTARSNELGNGVDYAYKTITVYPKPRAEFDVSPRLAMLDPSTLEARVKFYNLSDCNDTSGCSYKWYFGDGEIVPTIGSRDVTHGYTPDPDDFEELEDGSRGIQYDIKLVATTAHGCKDSLAFPKEVKIIGAGQIAFPNAFVPSSVVRGNNIFKPVYEGIIEYELFIYNRWGELIFTTKDVDTGWDGLLNGDVAKSDVYVWKAIGKFSNGRAFELAGDVTLIR